MKLKYHVPFGIVSFLLIMLAALVFNVVSGSKNLMNCFLTIIVCGAFINVVYINWIKDFFFQINDHEIEYLIFEPFVKLKIVSLADVSTFKLGKFKNSLFLILKNGDKIKIPIHFLDKNKVLSFIDHLQR